MEPTYTSPEGILCYGEMADNNNYYVVFDDEGYEGEAVLTSCSAKTWPQVVAYVKKEMGYVVFDDEGYEVEVEIFEISAV